MSELVTAFAVRLRDLLCTLESTTILSSAERRVRGLAEQLQFACLALPCAEAFVALEIDRLGRLEVPGVATADGWRETEHEFLPSGTPFAYLLGGGGGYAVQLEADDQLLAAVQPVVHTVATSAIFVPIRVGGEVMGGAALLSEGDAMGDAQLAMAERLAEVLALTMEAYRTDRVLLELFAALLPDLFSGEVPTSFASSLGDYVHRLRLSRVYRDRVELAQAVAAVAAQGSSEARLARDLMRRMRGYVRELAGADDFDDFDDFDDH